MSSLRLSFLCIRRLPRPGRGVSAFGSSFFLCVRSTILDSNSAIPYTLKVLLPAPTLQGESMQSRLLQAGLRVVLVLLTACFTIAVARAQNPTHVITGTVEKVDAGAKTIAVKTADGTVETAKFTEKTVVHGLKDGAKGADLVGKEGGHVIVHATGEGAEKTAHSVEWFGEKTVHTTEGTVDTSAPPSVSGEDKSLGILAFCGTATPGCALLHNAQ